MQDYEKAFCILRVFVKLVFKFIIFLNNYPVLEYRRELLVFTQMYLRHDFLKCLIPLTSHRSSFMPWVGSASCIYLVLIFSGSLMCPIVSGIN